MKPVQLWLAVLVICGCVVGSAWYVGHTIDMTERRAAYRVEYESSANRHILPTPPDHPKFSPPLTDGVDWQEEAAYAERSPRIWFERRFA